MRRRAAIACLALTACGGGGGSMAPAPIVLWTGDSTASGQLATPPGEPAVYLAQRPAARLHKALGAAATVVDASEAGLLVAQLVDRLPGLLVAFRPAVVVLRVGAADALKGTGLDAAQRDLRECVRLVRAAGAAPVLVGMPRALEFERALWDVDFAVRLVAIDTGSAFADTWALGPVTLDRGHPDQQSSDRLVDLAIAPAVRRVL